MGKSRQAEHHQFLAWLIEIATEQKVDAIIVAGDIFDTGSPPSYARELYNQFIVNLQPTGIHLVILGGNHDSVATLGESKELLSYLNTHVIPGVSENRAEQVVCLNNTKAETQAIICAIPYLRPRDLLYSVAGQSGSEKKHSLQQAISEHYQAVYTLAKQQQTIIEAELGVNIPIVATGHLTTVDAKSSDSVRDIYIGTLDAFPSSAFPPAEYIALGHIHRPQTVGGLEHVRYCGSPIPLSFDELNNLKTILLVEFDDGKFVAAKPKEVPRFQDMHLIKGDLKTIESEIKKLSSQYKLAQPAWLDIEVSSQDDYLNDLHQSIQAMVEGLPLEVLVLRKERKQRLHSIGPETKVSLQELNPKEVFERRLALENWDDDAKKARVSAVFNEALSDLMSARQE